MFSFNIIYFVLILIHLARGNVFIWGPKLLDIPSLKYINNDEFALILKKLGNPTVLAFKGSFAQVAENSKELFGGKKTLYIPNADIEIKNITGMLQYIEIYFHQYLLILLLELSTDEGAAMIKTKMNEIVQDNYLGLIIEENKRFRRDEGKQDKETTEIKPEAEEEAANSGIEEPANSVLYSAEGKAMVYSSKEPILNINGSIYNLGNTDVVTLDIRDTYTRISATIPLNNSKDKVSLRFKLAWSSGYWTLASIEVEDPNLKSYTLLVNKNLKAARNFSYHCAGEVVFRDLINQVELTLFDLQIQPDSQNDRFSDAYDCISFITVPIWSGLLVVAILSIGLGLGLVALDNIKITHGCENIKLKDLCITME